MNDYDAAVARLETDFNTGQYAKTAYDLMKACRNSDNVALPDDLKWLGPIIERYKDDAVGYRKFLLHLLEVKGARHRKMEGSGDITILRGLYRLLYQYTLITERRARLNKAIEIYRQMGVEITNITRARISSKQLVMWAEQKARYLEKVKAANGGKLGWFARNVAIEKFWRAIDAKLDEKLKSLS